MGRGPQEPSDGWDPLTRWSRTWQRCGSPPPPGLFERLVAAYREPHRAYHTIQHLAECFGHLDAAAPGPSDPAAVELALWFHDAVYDTRSSDNEARSAAWAREVLASLDSERLDRVEALILVTRHDAEPDDADQEILLDVDLAILGAPEPRFEEYEGQVREEYAWVPEAAYRAARAEVLAGFAARSRIYRTRSFRSRLEARARANLRRALARLAG